MVLEAAETVLQYLVDKSAFGDFPKKNKKCWYHLIEERQRDLETERMY
jgi:hypothetical protein